MLSYNKINKAGHFQLLKHIHCSEAKLHGNNPGFFNHDIHFITILCMKNIKKTFFVIQ
jgi:hypothetical protein